MLIARVQEIIIHILTSLTIFILSKCQTRRKRPNKQKKLSKMSSNSGELITEYDLNIFFLFLADANNATVAQRELARLLIDRYQDVKENIDTVKEYILSDEIASKIRFILVTSKAVDVIEGVILFATATIKNVTNKCENAQKLLVNGSIDAILDIWSNIPNKKTQRAGTTFFSHYIDSGGDVASNLLIKDGTAPFLMYALGYLKLPLESVDICSLARVLRFMFNVSKTVRFYNLLIIEHEVEKTVLAILKFYCNGSRIDTISKASICHVYCQCSKILRNLFPHSGNVKIVEVKLI